MPRERARSWGVAGIAIGACPEPWQAHLAAEWRRARQPGMIRNHVVGVRAVGRRARRRGGRVGDD